MEQHEKRKMINNELHIWSEQKQEYLPKYITTNSGMRKELDEEYMIYVLEGTSFGDTVTKPNPYDNFNFETDELPF